MQLTETESRTGSSRSCGCGAPLPPRGLGRACRNCVGRMLRAHERRARPLAVCPGCGRGCLPESHRLREDGAHWHGRCWEHRAGQQVLLPSVAEQSARLRAASMLARVMQREEMSAALYAALDDPRVRMRLAGWLDNKSKKGT